jgi:hypothetical protein
VWYQLSFEGYPESEAEWFPASRIRSEHPQADELIAAFDRGLEASGQGDVALPPHAAERAALLPFGSTTPQVGLGRVCLCVCVRWWWWGAREGCAQGLALRGACLGQLFEKTWCVMLRV